MHVVLNPSSRLSEITYKYISQISLTAWIASHSLALSLSILVYCQDFIHLDLTSVLTYLNYSLA